MEPEPFDKINDDIATGDRCPYVSRRSAGDETYDICTLNGKSCLLEDSLSVCDTYEDYKSIVFWEECFEPL